MWYRRQCYEDIVLSGQRSIILPCLLLSYMYTLHLNDYTLRKVCLFNQLNNFLDVKM